MDRPFFLLTACFACLLTGPCWAQDISEKIGQQACVPQVLETTASSDSGKQVATPLASQSPTWLGV